MTSASYRGPTPVWPRMVKEGFREYGISDATYDNWKAKYGGMEIADIRELKELAGENQRLKQMYAALAHETGSGGSDLLHEDLASSQRCVLGRNLGAQAVHPGLDLGNLVVVAAVEIPRRQPFA